MKNPGEVKRLVELFRKVAAQRGLLVAMESTGTFGDPLRQALGDAGVEVHCVSGKATANYAEIGLTECLRSMMERMQP